MEFLEMMRFFKTHNVNVAYTGSDGYLRRGVVSGMQYSSEKLSECEIDVVFTNHDHLSSIKYKSTAWDRCVFTITEKPGSFVSKKPVNTDMVNILERLKKLQRYNKHQAHYGCEMVRESDGDYICWCELEDIIKDFKA